MRLKSLLERFVRSPIPGTVMGYDSGDPQARTVQGDDSFPFFKDPADLDEAQPYFKALPTPEEGEDAIPVATTLEQLRILDAIDVRGFRTLTLFVSYESCAAGDTPTLGLVPEAAIVFEGRGKDPTWVFYGVVDPTLRGGGFVVGSTATSLEARSTAYRDCYVGQLDLSFQETTPRKVMLFFDVAPVAEIRFRIGSVARTSEDTAAEGVVASLHYQLGR